MTNRLTQRLATTAAASALVLGGALAAAPSAAADNHSPKPPPVSTMAKHNLKDGCFRASYGDPFASIKVYYSNRCKRAHKLRIYFLNGGGAAATKTLRVGGHDTGSYTKWFWGTRVAIRDLGRA